jgi:hypothetical protein
MTTKTLRALTAFTAAALLTMGAPAYASHGGGNDNRVVKTGTCSDGAHWKLKVKSDNSALEVEGEVDSNKAGQTWSWKIKDNGATAAKGSATTGGRSGSFSVGRRIADKAGTDNVTFRATRNGQVCSGSIAF